MAKIFRPMELFLSRVTLPSDGKQVLFIDARHSFVYYGGVSPTITTRIDGANN